MADDLTRGQELPRVVDRFSTVIIAEVCDEPNARLIAAAPDLLAEHKQWAGAFAEAMIAVLQEDFTTIKALAKTMPLDFVDGHPVIVSAAIAKAEGK